MHRASLLGALLLLLALTSPGSAQPGPAPTISGSAQPEPPAEPCLVPVDAGDARAWFRVAKEQANAGHGRCAKEAYIRSFRLLPSYDSAGNGGMHAATMGDHALACQLLSYSLAHIPESMDAPKKEAALRKMTESLAESLRHVGRVRVETRAGAAITVDGEPAGLASLEPLELCLQPGSRLIDARLEGFQPERVTVEVKVGPPQSVALPLKPMVAPQPAAPPQPDGEQQPSDGPSPAVGIAGLVAGGAGVFAGIALLLASAGRADTVDELGAELDADPAAPHPNPCGAGPVAMPRCDELATASEEKRIFLGTGIAALVVGGVVLTAGTVYLLLPDSSDEAQQAVRLAPLVDHQHAGVVLSGSF